MAVLFLTAGCITTPPPPHDACGAAAGPQDAPLLWTLAETPLSAARRLAAAVQDSLVSDEPKDVDGQRWIRWETAAGTIAWEKALAGGGVTLTWDATGARGVTMRGALDATLRAFGADALDLQRVTDADRDAAYQKYRGVLLDGARAQLSHQTLMMGPFHAVAPGETVGDAEAFATAKSFAACASPTPISPRADFGWRAHNGTLARVVTFDMQTPDPLGCSSVPVMIAARSGAPLGLAPLYCD